MGWLRRAGIRNLGFLLPLCITLPGIALHLLSPQPLQTLRNNVFDQYQRWQPRHYVDAPVRIIDIDEQSLARLGQWPWPRTRLAELVDKLQAAGAAAVGFDVMFAEPDRTSPGAMAGQWPIDDATRRALQNLPDNDRVFADALGRSGSATLGFVLLSGAKDRPSSAGTSASIPAPPYRIVLSGPPPTPGMPKFDSVIPARPELAASTAGYGALNFLADHDGIVRRVPMMLRLGDTLVPTLSAEALRVALGARNYIVKNTRADAGIDEIRIGQLAIPTTRQGEVWVHYSRPVENRYVPAWKVFAGEVPRKLLDGNIVFVGSSAQGLMDLRFSPRGIIPGVEAHAQAVEQILSGQALYRPGWARAVEVLAIILGGLLIAFTSIRARALVAALITVVWVSLMLAAGWYAFSVYGLLVDMVAPALVLVISFVFGSLLHHFLSEREHRWIKGVFSRYVSPNRVAYLMQHPDSLELGGTTNECSFVFTDLEGFTSMMEKMDPHKAVSLLNEYLDRMIAIAFRHEGTLDRIVGDAVAIMFSAPVVQADHRARALACALEMDRFADGYARGLGENGVRFGKTRIGIHSGEVFVGNVGGTAIFDYRALGDPVNTASRLESVNKHLGTTILISDETARQCGNVPMRPAGRLVLKGRTQALLVLEPLTERLVEKYAPMDDYLAAYDLMRDEKSEEAKARFAGLRRAYPDDPLVDFHLRRLARGENGEIIILESK